MSDRQTDGTDDDAKLAELREDPDLPPFAYPWWEETGQSEPHWHRVRRQAWEWRQNFAELKARAPVLHVLHCGRGIIVWASGKVTRLTPSECALLQRWIELGPTPNTKAALGIGKRDIAESNPRATEKVWFDLNRKLANDMGSKAHWKFGEGIAHLRPTFRLAPTPTTSKQGHLSSGTTHEETVE